MILVDTHVALWLAGEANRLGYKASERLQSELAAGGLALAAISLWEIGMLVERNRIIIDTDCKTWLDELVDTFGLSVLGIDPAIAADSVKLPGYVRRDPSDRLIIATARQHELTLVTADRAILDFASTGQLSALNALT